MERSRARRLASTLIHLPVRLPVSPARPLPWWLNLGAYFNSGEEEGDLVNGVLERVRTVHRIRFDRLGEILTDRPWSGIRGIGRSHDLSVERHCVLSLEHLNDDRRNAQHAPHRNVRLAPG